MPLVDLGIAQVEVQSRTLAQRLDCNRMIRRWAGDRAVTPDEDDLRAHRVNFITFGSYSAIAQRSDGFEAFRLPQPGMSDAEFEAVFALYLTIKEPQYIAWNQAVADIVMPREKTSAPPEALSDEEKRSPE